MKILILRCMFRLGSVDIGNQGTGITIIGRWRSRCVCQWEPDVSHICVVSQKSSSLLCSCCMSDWLVGWRSCPDDWSHNSLTVHTANMDSRPLFRCNHCLSPPTILYPTLTNLNSSDAQSERKNILASNTFLNTPNLFCALETLTFGHRELSSLKRHIEEVSSHLQELYAR